MKKIVALVAVLFSVVVPVQAQADTKSLVIIDSYFQSSIAVNAINSVGSPCKQVKPIKNATASSPYNHGTAMYAIAKLQNPTLSIIPVCASSAQSDVFPSQLISSLEWVKQNSSKVSSVSISLTFNKTETTCLPVSPVKKNIPVEDAKIRSLISDLSSIGIPVFASAGNSTNRSVSYPGCIPNVMSVAHANEVGQPISWSDNNTDYFVKITDDGANSNYQTTLGVVAHTSSSATAALAAIWTSNSVAPGVVKATK